MSLAAARDGLQARLATITGLRAYDTWPDRGFSAPGAIVLPISGEAHSSYDHRSTIHFEIVVAVSAAAGRASQNALDAYLAPAGAGSIQTALEADGTLGGAAEGLIVHGWRDYEYLRIADVDAISVTFDVEVWVVW